MRFFYHYNKPASKKAGRPVISLHFNKTCHLVKNIVVGVPTEGRIRKRQPYFIMCGSANSLEIKDGVAIIS